MNLDQLLIGIFAALAIPASLVWYLRRRSIASGKRCWNCGNPMMTLRLADGSAGERRCPRCGDNADLDA